MAENTHREQMLAVVRQGGCEAAFMIKVYQYDNHTWSMII